MKKAKLPEVTFTIDREYLERNGLWNPRDNAPPLKGGFQVNIFGRRKGYLQLAEFIRRFAERDTANDPNYHEHYEGIMTVGENVRLHIILRKDDVGDSIWTDYFPRKKQRRASRGGRPKGPHTRHR